MKEGIDNVQWEEIELVLKSKRGQKHMNDVSRWFAVWRSSSLVCQNRRTHVGDT
jgi:hypothetical protein